MGRPRKDRGPTNVGVLQPLKESVEAEQAKPRVPDDDDDMSDEEAILSQPSQTERLFGENGLAAQREKAEREREAAAAARAAASSSRSRPASSSRKRKSASPPATAASHRPKRNTNNLSLNYKDPADDDLPKPYNSDDDFQTETPRPLRNKDGSIPKRRGRPPKRRRDSEPVYISSKSGRAGPSSQGSGSAHGASSQDGKLRLNFSSLGAGKNPKRAISEETLAKWKRIRNEGVPMHSGERTIAMNAFRDKVQAPPNNARKMIWLEPRLGRAVDADDVKEAHRVYFKEWEDDWEKKRNLYIDFCAARKLEKPLDVNPTITEKDAKRWIKEFLDKHGNVEQPEVPPQYRLPSKRRRLSRSRSVDITESEVGADHATPAVANAASEPAVDVVEEEEEEEKVSPVTDARMTDVPPTTPTNGVQFDEVVDVDAMPAVGETRENEDEVDEDLDDSNDQKNEKMVVNGGKVGKAMESVDLTQDEVKTSKHVQVTFLGFLIFNKKEGTDDKTDKDFFVFDDERSTSLTRRLN